MDRRETPIDPSVRRGKSDVLFAALLVVIPILIYGIPSALGHPNLPGDDRLQNFPLRVLVGAELRGGTFPTFDPYIWSGAPLLGGWNAGALYPFTMLFGFLPAAAAWAINEMAVYWVAALGMYTFLRAVRLRPFSSWLGAVTFAFAGSLDVQLVHFGVVAGESWIPLILLALVKLGRGPTPSRRAAWIGLVGVAGAMSVLAGEPRAIDTVLVVVLLYFAWLVARNEGHRLKFIGSAVAGAGLATLISAVQWLPGAIAVSTSQRAAGTYGLFTSGSLNPRWLSLLFAPNLLGGSGTFGTPSWFTTYSLPEVMGYAGLLAIVAAFGLFGTLRRGQSLPDWLAWEVIGAVGILLALGGNLPLAHLLARLPLFGSQRLQSRNIAVTDLALAVLLSYWVEELFRRRDARSGAPRRRRPDLFQVLSLLPVGVAGILSVAALIGPADVAEFLGATAGQAGHAHAGRPLFVVGLVVVVGAAALILGVDRLRLPARTFAVGAIVLVDLAAFNVTSLWPIAVGPAASTNLGTAAVVTRQGPSPQLVRLASALGLSGRYVIYNPDHYNVPQVKRLLLPDLNLFDDRFSAQGYSSIVDADYATVTGSHAPEGKGLETLSPSALSNGALDQLDTTTLVTLPLYLVVVQPPDSPTQSVAPATPTTGSRTVKGGASATWYFGQSLDVQSLSLPITVGPTTTGGWRVGLLQSDGSTAWQGSPSLTIRGHTVEVRLTHASSGTGLVVDSTASRRIIGPPTIDTHGNIVYTADGSLADALVDGWSFAGDLGQLAYFTNRRADAPLTLKAPPGRSIVGASIRSLGGPAVEPTSAAVRSPHGVEVVRAVAAIPGWQATWKPSQGPARSLAVRRSGLAQAVTVPAGTGVVTWTYDAPGIGWGVALTLAGLAFLLAVLGLAGQLARRGGGRKPPS